MAERPTGAPVPPGLIARASSALRNFIPGVSDRTWFGPGQPQAPIATPGSDPERVLPYPPGFNLRTQVVRDTGYSFEQLRALADNCDLLRFAIETRKDQIARLSWTIRRRDNQKSDDARTQAITESFRYLDDEVPWSTWIRMFCEEMFVLDACVLHPRYTRGGQLMAVELIDGSTIVRKIDKAGRTPRPPGVAYQQILYGMPAKNFNRDQLLYLMRNKRVHKFYGYSHVEQVIYTVNIMLRRQKHQLDYYTEGNVPEALCGTPETWTLDNIKDFQFYFDSLMDTDNAMRRRMKFIPGEIARNLKINREPELKGEYDEWLARVISYCFSLPPTAYIRQNNRATAESSSTSSLEEGLEPTKLYIEDSMNLVLAKWYEAPDLEFKFHYEASVDRQKQAAIHETYIRAGVLSPNEARAQIGLGPRDGGDLYAEQVKEHQMEMAADAAKEQAQVRIDHREKGGIRSNASDPAKSTS